MNFVRKSLNSLVKLQQMFRIEEIELGMENTIGITLETCVGVQSAISTRLPIFLHCPLWHTNARTHTRSQTSACTDLTHTHTHTNALTDPHTHTHTHTHTQSSAISSQCCQTLTWGDPKSGGITCGFRFIDLLCQQATECLFFFFAMWDMLTKNTAALKDFVWSGESFCFRGLCVERWRIFWYKRLCFARACGQWNVVCHSLDVRSLLHW